MQYGKVISSTNSKLNVSSVSFGLFKNNANCERFHDEGLGTSNRGDWLSPSSWEKRIGGNFTMWRKIHNAIQKGPLYDVGGIRLEPQKDILTSELPMSFRTQSYFTSD
ncbi:hypothetical protein NPIL_272081 [Nephila pilipes]|uniref:Uncharacterized protein n=1 Tax=Nephila pilipes TaxID=299642 RepID=A0A8X6TW41_NEPPI|nr:hypothetical protein NPIL_272081 [Nephila pilipes]